MVSVKSRRDNPLLTNYYTPFHIRVNTFRYLILLYISHVGEMMRGDAMR